MDKYSALGLQTTFYTVKHRDDTKINLEHICRVLDSAFWLASLEAPVKLVALGEGAIQGFTDSMLNMEHVKAARELMTEVPGMETEILAAKAKELKTYLIGQVRAKEKEFKDRYFNVVFILNPKGEIIHKYHKLQVYPNEPSATPHDLWDRWVELYGDDLDAFYPVADTEIGRLGTMVCMEGSYPEPARGLAMNGAEVIYRPSYVEPWVGNGWFELQNRSRALDNNCYVISPNTGSCAGMVGDGQRFPIDFAGGNSMIVDYRGNVISRYTPQGDSYVSATIDIDGLREFRAKSMFGNWLKDLRTEQYAPIYRNPIYPKNTFMTEPPKGKEARKELLRQTIQGLFDRGTWVAPEKL
ncbi:MAG: hydrolase [Candidatus Tectomicrobia bacterium]|nr:hydrolase [Candidatus Tectomicrobia bacterium]